VTSVNLNELFNQALICRGLDMTSRVEGLEVALEQSREIADSGDDAAKGTA
jgi:hypothetical protein